MACCPFFGQRLAVGRVKAVVLQRESTEESWGLEIGKSKDGVFIQSVVTVPLMGFSSMKCGK